MIKFKTEGVELPHYATIGSSGMDVVANSILKAFKGDQEITGEKLEKMQKGFEERGYIKLRGFERILFGTGLTVADMDNDLEVQVRARSGVALKRGLLVANSPGTVDSDYRGQVGVIIYNSTPFLNKVEKGERIAQLVSMKIAKPVILDSDVIYETERAEGGFGSTGTK